MKRVTREFPVFALVPALDLRTRPPYQNKRGKKQAKT